MAKLEPGIIGSVRGKVGNVVVANRKGVAYLRALPRKRKGKISDKEKANRARFARAQEWLSPIKDFVRAGFRGYSLRAEGFVIAKSYLLKQAFVIKGDGWDVDPALAVVSYGDLPLPSGIKVEKQGSDELLFTWHHEIIDSEHRADQAMLLAYCLSKSQAMYTIHGQLRHSGRDVLKVYSGAVYQVYIAFMAADRSRQSMSVYLGEVEM